MALLQHIWDFVVAVVWNWFVLAGGIVGVLMALYEKSKNRPIIGRPFWSVMILALFVASFMAWAEERTTLEKVNEKISALNIQLDRVSVTPKEIGNIFEGRTSSQGEALASVHLGKWMEHSGTISDIGKFSHDGFVVTFVAVDAPTIFALGKSPKWNKQLAILRKGETIRVLGKISTLDRHTIWLKESEILEIQGFPTPTPTATPTPEPSPTPAASPASRRR